AGGVLTCVAVDAVPKLEGLVSVQLVELKSSSKLPDRPRPSCPASAAGFWNAASGPFCAATLDCESARSRAFSLGIAYAPAKAVAGARIRAARRERIGGFSIEDAGGGRKRRGVSQEVRRIGLGAHRHRANRQVR